MTDPMRETAENMETRLLHVIAQAAFHVFPDDYA